MHVPYRFEKPYFSCNMVFLLWILDIGVQNEVYDKGAL